MKTRRPRHRWEWDQALVAAQLGANAWATGHAWATRCWHWDARLSEDEVVAREGGVSLEDFQRRYRQKRALSSLRRDFKDLVDAGLLVVHRRHSPASPNVYVPRMPDLAAVVPEEVLTEGNTAQQRAVNSAQQRAVNSAQQRAVFGDDTARQRAEHRSDRETALFSPEPQEPPTRTHVRPRAREDGTGGGGSWSPEETAQVDRALQELLGALPPEVTPDITTEELLRCRPVMSQLLEMGWRPHQLLTKINRPRSWNGVAVPGAVLHTRLVRQLKFEPPYRPQPAAAATAARREQVHTEAASHAPTPPEDFRARVDRSRPSGHLREQEVSA